MDANFVKNLFEGRSGGEIGNIEIGFKSGAYKILCDITACNLIRLGYDDFVLMVDSKFGLYYFDVPSIEIILFVS